MTFHPFGKRSRKGAVF